MPQSSVMSRMVILSKDFFKSIRFKEASKACFVAVDIAFTSLDDVVDSIIQKVCRSATDAAMAVLKLDRDVCGRFPLPLPPWLGMTTCVELEKPVFLFGRWGKEILRFGYSVLSK